MNLPRRKLLHLGAGALALPSFLRSASAQAYPSRPVRIVVGFAAGGGLDIVARLTGQWLSERLGQQFIIENRPGAAGNIGASAVVGAAPDGYTLLQVNPTNAINATLYEKLNFDFLRDIVPVAGIVRVPSVVLVHPSVPAQTITEFIAYAKTNPGKINMATNGNGSASHIPGEQFKMLTGVDLVHVPYRGTGPALTDLLGGQVQLMFVGVPATVEYIAARKLRALAVTTATRSEALPDIPTVGEFVPGYEFSNWQGVGAPKNTPADVVERLNREINAGLVNPNMKARLRDLGATPFPGSAANFGRFIVEETEKLGKVVKFAGIRAD